MRRSTPPTTQEQRRQLVAALRRRCGRGGVRLTYDMAELCLFLLGEHQLTAEERTNLRLAIDKVKRDRVRAMPGTRTDGGRATSDITKVQPSPLYVPMARQAAA